ncbi:receptor-type tyrosine-protein phosphatase zeta isoform X9 [Phyllopteryx taeniolatus]|uniref:receptor-type tyrosine-protein phosphatase zeta isoform X9 n=1 Tax=Phyllopteryx taeniolatus TaxID=161469 RepID=UPI002AD3CF03|nr:receptor-type tyrosine-protein phosphatase zeta isoform X9 [Phyllopteryx taeniolatus]
MDASRAALLHILLTLQQVGGYTYRNQRKFTEDIDWSYAGTLNQNNWAKKFPSCSNAKQSPIDVEENLAQVKLQYQNLRLDGWENLTGRRTTIKNDGKTVALDVDGDFYVSGGGLGSKFKAGRITFHWGRCNASSEGSEHSLDGVKYPLEMQIYCYQPQRFESFDQTVKAGGPITALAVLFEVSSEDDNANFAPIVDAINGVSRYGKRGQVAPFSPRALLPNSTDKYFIYNGSLTTPPCSETVEWIVFKNTVYISADQLEVFCEVMTMEQAGYVMLMDYLQNNYREQQRKFMGQVFSSYTGTEELLTPVCSSEPENLEATSYNRSSLLVTWERPRAVYDSAIEKYSVSYKMADAEDAAPSEYLTDGDQDVGAILDDLVANSSYVVQVVAVCANGLYGRVSDPMTFAVPPDGPDVSDSSHESRVGTLRDGRRKAAVPLAVISALTALGLALLIGILLYWRMCFQTAHFYVDESASPRVAATPAFTSAVSLPVCLLDEKAALPVKDFVKHVAELHRTCGFQRKFEEVQASTADVAMTSETSDHPDNKSKNRYSNILAFDRSRVRLSAADKDGGGRAGDYINANFVDGFKMRHAYIAAQGPLKSSTDDFWRMIWEQNVGIVVMITNLLEKGRRKCDQYWPADVREDYGGLVVALKSVQKLAHYTQRTFTVTKAHVKKGSQRGRSLERVVTQYHYTQWPDMGVPEHALPLISFIRKSSRARTANMGPVVVHCSAGVGRTGTYLVLDSMLRQMRQEDAVDVDGFLRHVRTQRNYLVQTQEQYVFIHDALAEAVLCGDTEVAAPRLHAYVERLLTPRHDGNTPLDRQLKVERPSLRGSERLPRRFLSRSDPRHMFHIRKISNRNVAELLSAEAANADDYASALHDDNRHKNRSGSLLPVERSRVRLSPCAGDASDYINASYVTGYRQSKEFIITQNPLPGTVKDFWRMIWDQNARVIVSLSGPALAQDEDEDEEAGPCVFWPGKGQPIGWETLTVTQTCENLICLADEDPLLVHRLDVRAAQDDFVLDVRLYRAPCWPNPDSGTSDAFLLLELLRREEEKEEEEGEETSAEEGPVVVLDRAGGVTAGTFCALSSLIGQLHGQRRVDVFRAARMTNLSRPGTFRTRDQLAFLYEALLGVLDKQQRQEEEDGEEDGEDGEEEPPRSAADSLQSLV